MSLITKIAGALAAVAALALLVTAFGARSAYADDLPFKAFGSGLKAGQTVEAHGKGGPAGKGTADAAGNWIVEVPATKAANGDRISFTIDGKAAKESVTFQSGQFTPVPGIALTLAPEGAATPTPPAAPAPSTAKGTFAAAPVFSPTGQAQVVYNGGTVDELLKAATSGGAKTAWGQGSDGTFIALIPGAPDFVNAAFFAAFRNGFTTATSVTLVR